MNKTVLSFVLIAFAAIKLSAQETYYYQLIKKVHSNVVSTDVSGGQFITFINDLCFDSNKNGYSVGNGTLKLNPQAIGSYKTYEGKSYWGEDASFRFKFDLSILNVVLDNGDVYVYKRTTPPTGVTTCSLIRKPETRGGEYKAPVNPVQPTYPQGGYSGGGTNNGSNTGSTNNNRRTETETPVRQPQRKWCRNCGGSGKCRICNGTGWVHRIGIGHDSYCSSCPNHSGRCSSCNGRGEWYE